MSQAEAKRKARGTWAFGSALASLGLALCLSSGAARASGAAQCAASCDRHVDGREARTRICGVCLYGREGRASWVAELAKGDPFPRAQLERALADPDWQVSAEAARHLGKGTGRTEEAVLASWLVGSSEQARAHACLQAARIGAAKGHSLREWQKRLSRRGGADGHRAFSLLARCEAGIVTSLELELYGLERGAAQEALTHLAQLRGQSAAHVVLDAMRTRPKETDRIAADVLLEHARRGAEPVGAALVKAATKQNEERVNRLVPLYVHDVQEVVKKLPKADALERVALTGELAAFGPLAAPELEALLRDEDLRVRLRAGRALAKGEGGSMEDAVRARVRPKAPKQPASIEVQVQWLSLYGASGDKGCATGIVAELASDEGAPEEVRAAALEAHGACAGVRAQKVVSRALDSEKPGVRAGAVRALEAMPRSPAARTAAAKALQDEAPEVLAAAIRAVAAQRQTQRAEDIARLLGHASAPVRAEAAKALGVLSARAHAKEVAELLRTDPDREVRLSAADALGELGGPNAVSALTHAATNDPESRVRYVADQWLKRLGFGSR